MIFWSTIRYCFDFRGAACLCRSAPAGATSTTYYICVMQAGTYFCLFTSVLLLARKSAATSQIVELYLYLRCSCRVSIPVCLHRTYLVLCVRDPSYMLKRVDLFIPISGCCLPGETRCWSTREKHAVRFVATERTKHSWRQRVYITKYKSTVS